MKKILFGLFVFLITCSLFAQVSFQNETRSFTQLGLTTNEQIAGYLQIGVSDLLPIFQHSSMRGLGASISPADFYDMISDVVSTKDMRALIRITNELGVDFERFLIVFFKEMDELPEADVQMTLAMYRIGVKWGIVSP